MLDLTKETVRKAVAEATDTDGAHLLPVTTHLAAVNKCLELRVDPLLDRWPDWIREPWTRRLHESTPAP